MDDLIDITIGFTGTSDLDGMTGYQYENFLGVLRLAGRFVLRHGDCVGADSQAHVVRVEGYKGIDCAGVVIHPPEDPKKRAWCKGAMEVREPRPYLARNRDIVDESNLLITTPRTQKEVLRSGTWATIRYARKTGKPVIVIPPWRPR